MSAERLPEKRPARFRPFLRRARALAGLAILAATLSCAATAAGPASAYNETDICIPGERVMLVGGGTGDLNMTTVKDCNAEAKWETTATYYSEKEVIFEKRGIQLSFSSDSALNPFTRDYSYSKAKELFPDPKDEIWQQLKSFALDSLSAKGQTANSRTHISESDSCTVYPVRSTDEEIAKWPGLYKLPPLPTPDGKTGTISFALAADLTAEQRSTVLDALTQYDQAQQGTRLPRIVLAPPTSAEKPTITFRDGLERFEGSKTAGEAVSGEYDTGRNGLTRWKSGSIYLTRTAADLTETMVVHEVLHVLGFQHTPAFLNGAGFSETTMAPELIGVVGTQRAGQFQNGWELGESASALESAIDRCTKKGMSVADANY